MVNVSFPKYIKWEVIFEVTFYGYDLIRGSFREIREGKKIISEKLELTNQVLYDNKENVEINFLLWVDKLPVEKLIKLPHDYYIPSVRYGQESVEVLEVNKLVYK